MGGMDLPVEFLIKYTPLQIRLKQNIYPHINIDLGIINVNYTINVQKKFKQLFKDLLDNDKFSKDEYDKICPKGSGPGIPDGNPKIHKTVLNNLPKFLPILSAMNTPGYNIVSF